MSRKWNTTTNDLDEIWPEDCDGFETPVVPADVVSTLLRVIFGGGLFTSRPRWPGGAASLEDLSELLPDSARALVVDHRAPLGEPLRRAQKQLAKLGVRIEVSLQPDETEATISHGQAQETVRYTPYDGGSFDEVIAVVNELAMPKAEFRRWRDSLWWDTALYYVLPASEWAKLEAHPNLTATLFVTANPAG